MSHRVLQNRAVMGNSLRGDDRHAALSQRPAEVRFDVLYHFLRSFSVLGRQAYKYTNCGGNLN